VISEQPPQVPIADLERLDCHAGCLGRGVQIIYPVGPIRERGLGGQAGSIAADQ